MVRSKVDYNMNAIREPPEPMGEDLECSETEHWEPASVKDVEAYL